MAQPAPSPNPSALPPSSYRPVPDALVDLVAQIAADRAGMEQAAAAPALVGAEPEKFDFQAKISEAYRQKQTENFQKAKTLFLEILVHAQSPACPAEFAKNSLYYVNCLVGLAETGKIQVNVWSMQSEPSIKLIKFLGNQLRAPKYPRNITLSLAI